MPRRATMEVKGRVQACTTVMEVGKFYVKHFLIIIFQQWNGVGTAPCLHNIIFFLEPKPTEIYLSI